MKIMIALGAAALMSCTASTEMRGQRSDAELDQALAGRTAGTPVDCIDSMGVNGPQVIDNHTVLYRQTGRVVWRNDLQAECPGLEPMTTMVIEIHGSQLCRNDHFRTLEPGSSIPGPTCRLGKFTPYRK